jgi:hypothetical protein
VDFVFVDDARQSKPSRVGIGSLVALGGVHVPATEVGPLEQALRKHCVSIGFPPDQQFKWSPGKKETFMKNKLLDQARIEFYQCVLDIAASHGARCCVVIEGTSRNPARSSSLNHEEDVVSLFLERVQWALVTSGQHGLVVAASPSGGPGDEEKFLQNCADLLHHGTEYMQLDKISLGVLTAKSRKLRLLQFADVVTSCAVSRVAGESNFSPPIWEMLKPLWRSDGNRIQGVGVKLHPDYVFANLHYWLLGEQYFYKANTGTPLPLRGYPYFDDPGEGGPLKLAAG